MKSIKQFVSYSLLLLCLTQCSGQRAKVESTLSEDIVVNTHVEDALVKARKSSQALSRQW